MAKRRRLAFRVHIGDAIGRQITGEDQLYRHGGVRGHDGGQAAPLPVQLHRGGREDHGAGLRKIFREQIQQGEVRHPAVSRKEDAAGVRTVVQGDPVAVHVPGLCQIPDRHRPPDSLALPPSVPEKGVRGSGSPGVSSAQKSSAVMSAFSDSAGFQLPVSLR